MVVRFDQVWPSQSMITSKLHDVGRPRDPGGGGARRWPACSCRPRSAAALMRAGGDGARWFRRRTWRRQRPSRCCGRWPPAPVGSSGWGRWRARWELAIGGESLARGVTGPVAQGRGLVGAVGALARRAGGRAFDATDVLASLPSRGWRRSFAGATGGLVVGVSSLGRHLDGRAAAAARARSCTALADESELGQLLGRAAARLSRRGRGDRRRGAGGARGGRRSGRAR